MGTDKDVAQLYTEARTVRAEIEALWNEAQASHATVQGAVSIAQTSGLSESERDFAVSFGLRNAERWDRLAELSERLGNLIRNIEQTKKEHEDG